MSITMMFETRSGARSGLKTNGKMKRRWDLRPKSTKYIHPNENIRPPLPSLLHVLCFGQFSTL